MIDQLRAVAIFARVAEEGSFSAAGRVLRLSTSVVSQHVSKLEQDLGVTLLYRSTRAISLTTEGKTLLSAAKQMMAAVRQGLEDITIAGDEPVGALKITMPGFVRESAFEKALWSFARQHRSVAITLRSGDEQRDLIKEGYDLALRLGKMRDSTLRSKKVGEFERKLVAAPDYLRSLGAPTGIEDLQRFEFVLMENLPQVIELWRGGQRKEIRTENARILVDSVATARSAVIGGMGIQRLPISEIADDLERGRLVEVLPEWSLPVLPVYAVWPGSGTTSKLREMLIEWLADKR